MCEPTTIALVAVAAVGAYAAYDAGQTAKEFGNYEAAQAEADSRTEAGAAQVEAERIRKMGAMAAAEAGAAMADSGQTLGSAGALAINREIYRGVEEDAYFALMGGKDRSQRMQAQATLSRSQGAAAARAGNISAFSSLIGGGSKAYTSWRTANPGSGGVGT